ncbi:hypothetical protein PZ892_09070 [Sphingobacterium sp. WM]|uniref:hypothetical protein n=1 Tax=Sphingobacterium sp. WM TaxID=3031802 RepID=UPI00240E8E4F|nr:hypothetical protein [Sphingobacterium sp. WM]WFB65358.1 hypothetical protein PZ892_09070 [Sphingobacterium sp. WM]
MHIVFLPKTIIELEEWMKEKCFNFDSYSINGSSIYEGFGIDKSDGLYVWFYTERGQKDNLKYFKTESEIVEYAFNQIKSDKWARTHCIGFSADINKIKDLKNILQTMEITFFEDQIPYYGIDRPVYRIFVSGCDIKKTEYLKEKYWTEK